MARFDKHAPLVNTCGMKPRIPISTIFFGILGLFVLAVGIAALSTDLRTLHPLLNHDGGLALIVSAIALLLSGAFPLALSLLAAQREE